MGDLREPYGQGPVMRKDQNSLPVCEQIDQSSGGTGIEIDKRFLEE